MRKLLGDSKDLSIDDDEEGERDDFFAESVTNNNNNNSSSSSGKGKGKGKEGERFVC